jgi:hypothetical protein
MHKNADTFEVSSTTFTALLESMSLSHKLGLNAAAKELYWKSNGKLFPVSTISVLIHDHEYLVFTELDKLPVFSPQSSTPTNPEAKSFVSIDDFYDALLKDEGLDGDDIAIVKGVFQKEKIKIKQLPRFTDEKLKEAGITQIGLREAILAVLGK